MSEIFPDAFVPHSQRPLRPLGRLSSPGDNRSYLFWGWPVIKKEKEGMAVF